MYLYHFILIGFHYFPRLFHPLHLFPRSRLILIELLLILLHDPHISYMIIIVIIGIFIQLLADLTDIILIMFPLIQLHLRQQYLTLHILLLPLLFLSLLLLPVHINNLAYLIPLYY